MTGSNTYQKLIKLTIINWYIQYWSFYSSGVSCTCATCSAGYVLTSGLWVSQNSQQASSQTASSSVSTNNSESQTAHGLKISTDVFIWMVVALTAIANTDNPSTIASLWTLINQVQLWFLLLLTRAYIPTDVQDVITGPGFALNPYSYIPFSNIGIYNSIIKSFNFDLSNSRLELLKLKSDSTIFNILSFIGFILLIILTHLILFILSKLFSKCKVEGKWAWCVKFINWILNKLINILTFGYYIRSFLHIYQYLIVSVINEIYHWNTSQPLRAFSFVLTFFFLIFCLGLIGITVYLGLSSYKINENEHSKLEEFIRGLKAFKRFKIHTAVILIRKTLYVIILITFSDVPSKGVIGILWAFQLGVIVYVILQRSFRETTWNIIKIINEVLFLILLFLLIFFNNEDNWTAAITSLYSWVLALNTIVTFVIVLCKRTSIFSIRSWVQSTKYGLGLIPLNAVYINQANRY